MAMTTTDTPKESADFVPSTEGATALGSQDPTILETNYKHCVQHDKKRDAKVLRFLLQSIAKELLPDSRVGWCLRRFQPGCEKMAIIHSPARQSAYYSGLMRCSLIWQCPVCAAKITETRRQELEALLEANKLPVEIDGKRGFVPLYTLSMLTFTIRHDVGDSCDVLVERLHKAYRKLKSGGWYQRFQKRYFVVGSLRALELTVGAAGWHPHFHTLFFHDSQLPEYGDSPLVADQLGFLDDAQRRWYEVTSQVGAPADKNLGVQLSVGINKIELYAVKLAGDREVRDWDLIAETTKQPVKHARNGNRSMTDLLIAYAGGDVAAGDLWIEATGALKGRRHLEPSKGLWKLLHVEISADEQAAEDVALPTDQVIASLTWEQWKMVLRHDARGAVLEAAASGDAEVLWSALERLGIERGEVNGESAS